MSSAPLNWLLKIGADALQTTAQTLCAAVNELKSALVLKANTADLSTVATSGSYSDLSNTPTIPSALADLTDDTTHRVVTDTEKTGWDNKASTTYVDNKNKITNIAVDITNWASDTTSQSGVTLYKKTIALNHVYVTSPSVEIGAATGYVLPTSAEQEAFDLLQYATVDSEIPCLYLYASDIPVTAFNINVGGAD